MFSSVERLYQIKRPKEELGMNFSLLNKSTQIVTKISVQKSTKSKMKVARVPPPRNIQSLI